MLTREDAVRRLDQITREIIELKQAFEQGWDEGPVADSTQAFLDKCGGWKDSRNPEEIIKDIHASRTSSNRGDNLFNQPTAQ